MLEACKLLFNLWNDQGIRYCHWKSNEHLLEGLNGETDLDVYVCPQDKELAETLLKKTHYLESVTQKGGRYPNVSEWMGFDRSTGKLVHIHLHYKIITGTKYCKEYVFPVEDLMISTRVLDLSTNVYVTDPNLEIIILYSRIALKAARKKEISIDKSDRCEIDFLKSKIQKDKVAYLCNQLLGGNGKAFNLLLEKNELSTSEWYKVYLFAYNWLKPYRKYSKIHVFFRHYYFYLRGIIILIANNKFDCFFINKKTLPGRSISICFLGQDGSGKSTVTIELCKWLSWKLAAHRFYLGSGDHYNGLLKRLISRGSKIKHRNDKQDKVNDTVTAEPIKQKKKKKNFKNFFPAVLLAANRLNVARRAYKEVLKADKYLKKGGIPLFDRFPQTQYDGIYDGPKIAESYRESGLDYYVIKKMAAIERKYIKKIEKYQPGLVFKLMLPPEESIRRKPFEDIVAVTRKHEITKNLQFPNSVVHTIDATQNYQQEILIIKNIIWDSLSQCH